MAEMRDTLEDFESYLSLERGMSVNTCEAYVSDVGHLMGYLEDNALTHTGTTEADLHGFLCTLRDIGIGARSQARMISGIRSYFKYLKLTGAIDSDPTALLESPRLGRHLPEVLSPDDRSTSGRERGDTTQSCDHRDSIWKRTAGVGTDRRTSFTP